MASFRQHHIFPFLINVRHVTHGPSSRRRLLVLCCLRPFFFFLLNFFFFLLLSVDPQWVHLDSLLHSALRKKLYSVRCYVTAVQSHRNWYHSKAHNNATSYWSSTASRYLFSTVSDI